MIPNHSTSNSKPGFRPPTERLPLALREALSGMQETSADGRKRRLLALMTAGAFDVTACGFSPSGTVQVQQVPGSGKRTAAQYRVLAGSQYVLDLPFYPLRTNYPPTRPPLDADGALDLAARYVEHVSTPPTEEEVRQWRDAYAALQVHTPGTKEKTLAFLDALLAWMPDQSRPVEPIHELFAAMNLVEMSEGPEHFNLPDRFIFAMRAPLSRPQGETLEERDAPAPVNPSGRVRRACECIAEARRRIVEAALELHLILEDLPEDSKQSEVIWNVLTTHEEVGKSLSAIETQTDAVLKEGFDLPETDAKTKA